MRDVYIDGSPKLDKICIVIDTETILERPQFTCITSNQYEYAALLRALELCNGVMINSDSQLVVNQVLGKYKVLEMLSLFRQVNMKDNKIRWIPRHTNKAGVKLDKLLKEVKTESSSRGWR